MSNHVYLTPREVAHRLRVAVGTLAKMRVRGDGPPFHKVGSKTVVYSDTELTLWMRSRERGSTSAGGN